MVPSLLLFAVLAVGQTGTDDSAALSSTPQTPAPPPADRWLVMDSLQGTWEGWLLDGNRLQVSGWTELSYTASSVAHSNLPLGFDYRANEFLVQQNWLRLERSVVTSGTTEPTVGFRSDTILPGSDYRFTLPRGIFNGQLTEANGQPRLYGIDPVQFYTEAYFPTVGRGLDVKLGRFFAQYGVESIDAPGNALLSHAYTMIYDPFTNTGVLGTLKLTDTWSVQAGLALGSDVFIDPSDEPTFLGSVKWIAPENGDSAQFSVILGSGRFNQGRNFNNPEIFDLTYAHKLNPRLRYNFEGLFGFETNVPQIGTADWLGVLNYLTCDITPRLSTTGRLEFFDDPQGQRTGFAGLYSAVSAGATFRPRKWLLIRPELRYDYNEGSRPFENKHGLFTAATDVIFRW